MAKQATLSSLPRGYKQTITKHGDQTVVIRLTRDYDKNKKRIARTYILSDDGETLQYAGYFTPSKKDTKSIFEARQNPNSEGRNKAIRNIASKAVPSDQYKPVKLDARQPRKPSKSSSKASSKAVEAPKAETQSPILTQPESPTDELETLLNETERLQAERQQSVEPYIEPAYPEPLPDDRYNANWKYDEDNHGFIEVCYLDDQEAWELVEPQYGEWNHDYLSYLWTSDPVNHNLNKINWLFLGFSDLKARGMLDGTTQEHDSLILRAQKQFPDILSDAEVEAIRQYTRRLTVNEFNDVWNATLEMMGMDNEEVFKYQPDEFMGAFEQDALFYHNLSWMLRNAYEEKINNIYIDENFHIRNPWE